MGITLSEQTWLFLLAVLCGVGIGLLFDVFRALRRVRHRGKIEVMIEDILFWLLVLAMIFALVLILSDGILRGFQMVGLFLGVLIYSLLFSRFMLWAFIRVFFALGWLFEKLFSAVRFLVLRPLLRLGSLLRRFGRLLRKKMPLRKSKPETCEKDEQIA